MIRGLAALLLLTAAPAIARAQEVPCAEGRERSAGRCCWPAQSWSEERARCEGAPTCPPPLVEHGDTCVAPALAAPYPASDGTGAPGLPGVPGAAALPPAYSVDRSGWPAIDSIPGISRLSRPLVTRGEDERLIVVMMALFDAGWALGWLETVIDNALGCTAFTGSGSVARACDTWPFAFIPVGGAHFGGLISLNGSHREYGVNVGLGSPSVILQAIGAIGIAIALANETTEVAYQPLRPRGEPGDEDDLPDDERPPDEGGGADASLVFGAPGADLGIAIDGRF